MVYQADPTTCLPAQVTYAFRVNSNAFICIALDLVSLTQYNTGTDNPSRKLKNQGLSGRLRPQASLMANLFCENCFPDNLYFLSACPALTPIYTTATTTDVATIESESVFTSLPLYTRDFCGILSRYLIRVITLELVNPGVCKRYRYTPLDSMDASNTTS